jgi:hypothetical protein
MTEERELFHIREQGAPAVNRGWIVREGPGVVALGIDMKSKHCVIGATMGGDNTAGIVLEATDESMFLDVTKDRDAWTIIEFVGYPGWRIHSADLARYTLAVCLVDTREPQEEETQHE